MTSLSQRYSPSKVIPDNVLRPPCPLGSSEHETFRLVMEVTLRSNAQESINKGAVPGVIIFYVFVKVFVDCGEGM